MPTLTDGRGTVLTLGATRVPRAVLEIHFPACRSDLVTDAETALFLYPSSSGHFDLQATGAYLLAPSSNVSRPTPATSASAPATGTVTPLGVSGHLALDNFGDAGALGERLEGGETTQQTLLRLEQKLALRPSVEELRNYNILRDTAVAPPLQAVEDALRFARLSDKLEHHLERRPEKQDLVDKNVLKQHSGETSADFLAAQAALEKARVQDSLGHKLELRPSMTDLIDHNILKDKQAGPAVQAAHDALAKQEIQSALTTKLEHRPSPEQVQQMLE